MRFSTATIAAIAIAATMSATPARADASFQLGYQYSLENALGGFEDRGERTQASAAGEVLALNRGNLSTHGDASSKVLIDGWVQADAGSLKASVGAWSGAEIASPWNTTRGSASASLTASSFDTFVIRCDGCETGTVGTLQFRILLDGYTHRARDASVAPVEFGGYTTSTTAWRGSAFVDAGMPGGRQEVEFSRRESLGSDGRTFVQQSQGVTPGYQDLSLQFVFGAPISLGLSLGASVETFVYGGKGGPVFSGHGSAVTDLSHGIAWAGITAVLDAQGRPVNAFTALDSAGVDYRASFASTVPEPGTWALMAAGLGVLGLLGARRRHRGA